MTAQIIDLAQARAERHSTSDRTSGDLDATRSIANALSHAPDAPSGKERFQFWTGESGRRYVHTVYDLLTCPTLPKSNYMLVKRDADGEPLTLSIGCLTNSAASLNLAEVRRLGAQLGATEVHVHLLADDAQDSKFIQHDLQAGYLRDTWQTEKTASLN